MNGILKCPVCGGPHEIYGYGHPCPNIDAVLGDIVRECDVEVRRFKKVSVVEEASRGKVI